MNVKYSMYFILFNPWPKFLPCMVNERPNSKIVQWLIFIYLYRMFRMLSYLMFIGCKRIFMIVWWLEVFVKDVYIKGSSVSHCERYLCTNSAFSGLQHGPWMNKNPSNTIIWNLFSWRLVFVFNIYAKTCQK